MKITAIIALVAAFFALWMSLNVSRETFARLPHLEDEYAYTYQAKIFAGGNIYIETPQPRRAFWQPFLIDEGGKRFGKYPPGYPLILAAGYLLNFPAIINAWLALLNVGLTYRLAREVFNEATGAVAAVLMAISPIAVMQNATLMPHTASLLLTTLTLFAIWRLEKGTHLWRWGIIAGLALGSLVAVRPFVSLTVAVPLVIYSLVRLVGVIGLHRSRPTNDWRTPRWASLRTALYHGDSSLNQRLRRDTALPCPPAVHHNDSFPSTNEGELPPAGVWWLKVFMLWMPIALLTGAAYWVSSQLPFYDNWYVLVIGLGMAVMALGYVALEWSDERVNPPLPRRFIPTLIPLLLVAIFGILLGALHPLFSYAVVGRGDPLEFAQDMAAGEAYTNLYTYIWEYDTPGFGLEHGREGRVVVADIDVPR
ncbi:MAG: glycosyltransferase family 39 protein, partial [Chloroflexi bacterium]|nr:glycosyltransferase family 39 protein [Chloroflexota bacterium]